MAVKDMLLLLSADTQAGGGLALAIGVARQQQSALTGLCLYREPAPAPADGWAVGTDCGADVRDRQSVRIRRLLHPLEAAFRAACEGFPTSDWVALPCDDPSADPSLYARLFDLVVLDRPRSRHGASWTLAERVLLQSGPPCLFAPEWAPAQPSFERVLIALNGGREASSVLQASLPFLKAAKEVAVACFSEEAHHLASCDGAQRHLARHGVETIARYADPAAADIGRAILDQSCVFGADLLVMGDSGRPRISEGLLAGATRTVLACASLPVLLAH